MDLDTASDLLNFSLEQSASLVSFCSICNKPFGQEVAFKRHVAYCRKARNRPRIRPKPCTECKAAKSKCSLQKGCTRCTQKGLDCIYPDNPRAESSSSSRALTRTPLTVTPDVLSTGSLQHVPIEVFESIGNDDQSWTSTGSQVLETPDDLTLESSTGFRIPNNIGVNMNPIPKGSFQEVALSGIFNDTTISSICQLSFPLSRIRDLSPVAESSASLIRQSLSAYPEMMLRRSTFPPFIHPHQDKSRLPEPLANCMAIAVLFASRNDDTRPFLWKSIREEQQRCIQKMTSWPKYDVFAAMQAQLIYITMRVVDGCGKTAQDREYNTDLLMAYKLFWSQLVMMDVASCSASPEVDSLEWQDWVLGESLTRIACVWFLVAQLPCHKSLWAATTPEAWKEEAEAFQRQQHRVNRPVTFGELYHLHKSSHAKDISDRLNAWNAGVDNVGLLLNVATQML